MLRDITIAVAFVAIAGSVPAAFSLAPAPGAAVAVIAPPWAPAGEAVRIVAASNGVMLDAKGVVVFAESPDGDFISKLYQAGAVLVLDAAAVATCLSPFRVPGSSETARGSTL
jgi:hypothetical protein